MTANTKQLESAKINALAEQYAHEGFSVTREPSEVILPFDLGGYRPDLIATKDNFGLIVEVNAKLARLPVERLRALAEEVGRHPGWRFLLVTLEDEENSGLAGISDTVPSWTELYKRVAQAQKLIAVGASEPALLYLWSIFEALLRKRAAEALIPIERFPLLRLIKHMYSLGELSITQYDVAMVVLDARNKIAHGVFVEVDNDRMTQFASVIEKLCFTWMPQD